jgi:hypothetical protein
MLAPASASAPRAASISALRFSEHFQAEADVLSHRHVREQRVGLEDRVDRPLERRQRRDVLAVEQEYLAFARKVEAGDQPEQRGLAATRGAEQGEELVLPDFDGNPVERGEPCRRPLPKTLLTLRTSIAFLAGRSDTIPLWLCGSVDLSFPGRIVSTSAGVWQQRRNRISHPVPAGRKRDADA